MISVELDGYVVRFGDARIDGLIRRRPGFVVDQESDEMLVIQERFAPNPIWKLPGGTADSGEDLHHVARREGSLVVDAV